MCRQIIYFIINSTILSLFALMNTSCQQQEVKKTEAVYTIKPHSAVRIYGVEIDPIFSKKFSEIEKELNAKITIDKKVSVIFISKNKNFVLKIRDQFLNATKDHIDIRHGPVDNASFYENPGSALPRSIVFYGALLFGEPTSSKQTIIKELETLLPRSDAAKELLDKISKTFITGTYSEGKTLKINFDMPGYPIAYFHITLYKWQIIYRYVFSKTKEVYPPI